MRYPPPDSPQNITPPDDVDPGSDEDFSDSEEIGYHGASSDPLFGFLLIIAVSIGLIPLINAGAADMRYTLAWGLMAGFGVLAWLLGTTTRIDQEKPDNLAWGLALGALLGVLLLGFGGGLLRELTELMFAGFSAGTLLAFLVFVMPAAETLFFRGVFQHTRAFWLTGLACTVWGVVLFFPLINRGPLPLVAGVILLMANMIYSYVRQRNGLAAAWLAQITVNILAFFVPFVLL